MLDAVIDYLPSPVDVPAINGIPDDGKDIWLNVTQVMTSRSLHWRSKSLPTRLLVT